ncbi:MAG TPA: sugar transferase, partial [Thermodesulfobacteriota bacterium]
MLRQRTRLATWGLYVVDLTVLVASFLVGYWIRDTYLSHRYDSLVPLPSYAGVIASSALIWSFLLVWFRLYASYRTKPLWTEVLAMLKVCLVGTLAVSALTFGLKLVFVSRLFIVISGATAFVLLSTERVLVRLLARHVRRRGYNWRNVLIVGTGPRARELATIVEEQKHWGLRLIGFVAGKPRSRRPRSLGQPVLGTIDDMRDILARHVVDEVIFAVSRRTLGDMEGAFLLCEELGIRAHVAADLVFPHMIARIDLDELHGIPLLTFSTTPHNEFLLVLKRVFDIATALVMLVVLSPLFAGIALAIRLGSPGPILFRQRRVGLNGRHFTLYKFRSMVRDAEARKHELLHLNEMDGPVFKITDDPRLTRIGKILRR